MCPFISKPLEPKIQAKHFQSNTQIQGQSCPPPSILAFPNRINLNRFRQELNHHTNLPRPDHPQIYQTHNTKSPKPQDFSIPSPRSPKGGDKPSRIPVPPPHGRRLDDQIKPRPTPIRATPPPGRAVNPRRRKPHTHICSSLMPPTPPPPDGSMTAADNNNSRCQRQRPPPSPWEDFLTPSRRNEERRQERYDVCLLLRPDDSRLAPHL